MIVYISIKKLCYICKIGGIELVEKLKSDPSLANQPDAVEGLREMGVLLKYCSIMGIADMVCKYLIKKLYMNFIFYKNILMIKFYNY